jgi:hypothetical protein
VPGFRIGEFAKAADVYRPTTPLSPKTDLTVRVHGDPEVARRALLQRLTQVDPNMGVIMTLRTLARAGRASCRSRSGPRSCSVGWRSC